MVRLLHLARNVVFALVLVLGCKFECVYAQMPSPEDIEYGTACGPIACFAAMKSLGIDTSLDDSVARCKWVKGKFVPLEDLRDALNSYPGVACQLGKISPVQLCELLRDDQTVVLLALRKNTDQTDHAVCAISVDGGGQIVKIFDYSELYQNRLIGDLTSRWDGHALVVRRSVVHRALHKFAYIFAPIVAVLLCLRAFENRKS